MNEHRVVHDYSLCSMVKPAQDGDLNARDFLLFSIKISCMSPASEGTCAASPNVPSGHTVSILIDVVQCIIKPSSKLR